VYVTGYSGAPGRYDYVTIAYNALTGARRWLSRYNGRAGGNDQGRAVAVSPDGRTVYVTGRSQGKRSGYDIATIAYNASTGAQRWAGRYNGPANLNDFGNGLAVAPSGRAAYVTGGAGTPGRRLGFVTIAYKSSSGKALWTSRTRGWSIINDVGSSAGVTPDGRTVVVANYTAGTTTRTAYATTAYNASTGAARWSRRYAGPAGYNDNLPAALGISPDGIPPAWSDISISHRAAALILTMPAHIGDAELHAGRERRDRPASRRRVSIQSDARRPGTLGGPGVNALFQAPGSDVLLNVLA